MRNWQKLTLLGCRKSIIRLEMSGTSWQYFLAKSVSFFLVGSNAGHWESMCSRSSFSDEQDEESKHFPVQLIFHLLHNDSVLNLPESIRACTVAIVTLDGDDPAEVQIG